MSFYDNSPELVDDISPPAKSGAKASSPASDRERALYPTMAEQQKPVEQPQQQQQPEPHEKPAAQGAEDQPPGVPENVAQLRAADRDRQMFDAQGMYSDVSLDVPAGDEYRELHQAAQHEAREVFADLGMPVEDARQVIDTFRQHTRTPPSEETVKGWQTETVGQLRREFGADAARALQDAHQLATRDPRVLATIEAAGLGDNPAIVLRLARLARVERQRGRLK